MKKFNVLTAFFAASMTLLLSQSVMAGPHEHGRHGGGQHGQVGLERMLKGLDLTDAQRQQIAQLTDEFKAKRTEQPQRQQTAEKFVAIIKADVFDEVAARQLIEQQQTQMIEQGVARLKLQHAIRAVLTAEQKAQLDAKMLRMKQKRQDAAKTTEASAE